MSGVLSPGTGSGITGGSATRRCGRISTPTLTGQTRYSRNSTAEPKGYLEYASWYFGRQPPADAVAAVIEHCPLTVALVNAINPGRSFHDLTDDLDRIRYPAR